MKKRSREPPSKAKYIEKNPVVSFHLPREILDKLNMLVEREGKTKSKILCDLLTERVEEDDARRKVLEDEAKKAFERGFETAKLLFEKPYIRNGYDNPVYLLSVSNSNIKLDVREPLTINNWYRRIRHTENPNPSERNEKQ
jgi:predicted DNA-binding protein